MPTKPENLLSLYSEADLCRDCSLWEKRRRLVFGEGDPDSPLVLIGEGPGDQEDFSGRPFVGRGGQMLDRAISDAGLKREELYICNTVKCRACDWVEDKPKNRAPSPTETKACQRWLLPQLALLAPKVILCIGGPSAKNLIDPKIKITTERGIFRPSLVGVIAIATLHPSYIMRMANVSGDGGYALLVDDLKQAWNEATKTEL
jgi:uracil-DNA glycosylase family 4